MSAGTRTVKLRGRAKKITFHVFDPKFVSELLDSGVIEDWREEDVIAATENRRKAAYKAKLTRSLKAKNSQDISESGAAADEKKRLADWDDFARDGLLR